MTEFVANQRYQTVRKQLDQLHYCLPFNVESTTLVERLLNDLLKTTEGYQKLKNEINQLKHDEKLNSQALVPLQKLNEKLTKENNKLHHEIIQTKEERDVCEIKWKQALRQLQEECQDLKFLVDSKDLRIKKIDVENIKMKTQMQKTLEKIYLPSQDQIVEGLSSFNENDGNNMLQGYEQSLEMTHTVQKAGNMDGDSIEMNNNMGPSAITSGLQMQETTLADQNQWAQEVRKSDERCEQYHQMLSNLQQKVAEEEQFSSELTKKIKVRDEEILRLHDLYQPVQNLEKINLHYQYEQNEKAVQKLSSQVDFLNRENDRLQRSVDVLKGDENGNMAEAQYLDMKKEVDDLAFANQTLKKDFTEATKLLRETQDKLILTEEKEAERIEQEMHLTKQSNRQKEELESTRMATRETQEQTLSLKSAFNSDRKMMTTKINDLESKVINRSKEIQSLESKIHMLCQSENSQKNELNFWNGKVSTLRRDLEYSQTFSVNLQNENRKLQADVENLKREYELREKDLNLARKEANGMHEDNERLNRMYQILQKEAFYGVEKLKKESYDISNEAGPVNVQADYVPAGIKKVGYQPLRADPPQAKGGPVYGPNPHNKKTQNMWQMVDDGFGSSRDFSNITGINAGVSAKSEGGGMGATDQQVTMKRDFS